MESRSANPARTSGGKLTFDDLLRFPDDGQRHELIDGDHYVTPSPDTRHQRVSVRLAGALFTYLEARRVGELFTAPYDVVLGQQDIVEPDLLVVMNDQRQIVTDAHVRGAPALVVEILSPGTRHVDRGVKRDLYDRAGIREYWIVDPVACHVSVHRRQPDAGLVPAAELEKSDRLTTPLLPEFSLDLRALFR